MHELLETRGLRTVFPSEEGIAAAVDGVDLRVEPGEILGLVGESGCGKSVTAFSILRLVSPPGRIVAGQIIFEGTDLLTLSDAQMRSIRGDRISMIFQEPMTSLNPVFRIGEQIAEVFRVHRSMSRGDADSAAVDMLEKVGIPAANRRARDYPHQLSGGMRQRVMIAMALACDPRLILADEPTTALDVTIQAQILRLLRDLQQELGLALILVTHDLGVVARVATRVAVMYAGRLVETGPVEAVFGAPSHPYTRGLLRSIPVPGRTKPGEPLGTIPGQVPNLVGDVHGCAFRNRCELATAACEGAIPTRDLSPGHSIACVVEPASGRSR